MMRAAFAGTLLVVLSVFSMPALAQINLLNNGSFETGDLTGWSVVNAGSGQFSVVSGTLTPLSGFTVPAPPDGTFASISDQNGPGSHILYQDVTVPAEGRTVLSFKLYYNNVAGLWADDGSLSHTGGTNQQLRIDIMDPGAPVDDVGAGVLQNIVQTADPDPFVFGYEQINAELTPFAGQTVRIRFAQVDNQFFFHMAIDDVRVAPIIAVPVNQPWALLFLILTIMTLSGLMLRQKMV